jgi:CRP/FNR family transcriptional regulator, cyclic AMP receptor protein
MELLRPIPVFSCLDEKELEHLMDAAIRKTYAKNTVILSEGDITDSLYVIVTGKVKTVITDENGKEIILSIFGPGDYFGEMALIDGKPRSATIVTREPSQLMIFSRNDLRKIFATNPDIVFNLLKGLVQRLRESNKKIESLAFMDVYGRVTRFLIHYARPQGDDLVVAEAMTHQEIANMVGSSREMVSRILKELIRGAYISVANKVITIHKKLPYSW